MPKEDSGKIRLIMIELEGNNETLQEGIRTFANAITRPVAPPRVPISLPPATGNGHTIPPQAQTTLDILEEASEAPVVFSPAPPAKKNNNKRKYSTPQIVTIDLNGGAMPLGLANE